MSKGRQYEPKDRLYHQAKQAGYASRAAYKLLELNQKYHLFHKDAVVLDLGCAPGSWSQVACEQVGPQGNVIGIDLQPLPASVNLPEHFHFLQGDMQRQETLLALEALLGGFSLQHAHVVLSDLSPKLCGIRLKDHVQSIALAEIAFALAKKYLVQKGSLILKVFPGEDLEKFRKQMAGFFDTTKILELDASRATSREVYCVARGFKSPSVSALELT